MNTAAAQPLSPSQWGIRVLGAIGCLCYAGLAFTSGVERSAILGLQHSILMEWPYAVSAEFDASTAGMQRHDGKAAVAHARLLVLHDPIDQRAISTYGLALLEAGKPDRARDALTLAAQLGWRDPLTQRYWFNEALRVGNAERASQALDAILRPNPQLPDRDNLLRQILPYNEGRAAMADRLKADPDWAGTFVSEIDGFDDADLDAHADVVRRTGPGHWTCGQAANLLNGLLVRGLFDDAAAVHRTVCADSGAIINDENFNQLAAGAGASVLDWNLTRRGDLVTSVNADTPDTHVLAMSSTATSTIVALQQFTLGGPGTYRVTWRLPDTSPDDAAALQISFDCEYDLGNALDGRRQKGDATEHEARFIVDDTCLSPVLRVWLSPNHAVKLAGLRVSKIGKQTPASPDPSAR